MAAPNEEAYELNADGLDAWVAKNAPELERSAIAQVWLHRWLSSEHCLALPAVMLREKDIGSVFVRLHGAFVELPF